MHKYITLCVFVVMLFSAAGVRPATASEKNYSPSLLDLVFRRTLSHKIDTKAEFIGKGYTVPNADVDHSWLLSDWDSTAQELAQISEYPADDSRAEFVRSYRMSDTDEVGYVWSWVNEGTQIYLVFHIQSDAGGDMTFVLNTHDITVDEAIIVSYFTTIRQSYRPFEVKKWRLDAPSHLYLPNALGHLGDEFFGRSEYFKPFAGEIISLPFIRIIVRDNQFSLYSVYDWGNDGELVEYSLPSEFAASLPKSTIEKLRYFKDGLSANLKVRLDSDGEIAEVVAGVIYGPDEDEIVFSKPVPAGLLGAGALPKMD